MPDAVSPLALSEPCLCAAVRQAARNLSQHYDAALAPMGISVNQYSVLVRAGRFGPCGVNQLAAELVMDRSTLGHLLRPLAARGLLGLGVAAGDRRRKAVSLTDDGAALVAAARPLWAAAQSRFVALYGASAAHRLRDQLDTVAALDFAAPPPVVSSSSAA